MVPGTYHVNELDPSPTFLLTDLSCDDADSTVDMPSREATIVVGQGETVTCTFTNTRQGGTFVIKKATDPAGLTNTFSFGSADSPCGGGFLLTGAAGSDTFSLRCGSRHLPRERARPSRPSRSPTSPAL